MSLLKKPIVFETTFSRFTAVERIGEGGAGTVYRASDEKGAVIAVRCSIHRRPAPGNADKGLRTNFYAACETSTRT
jgi:hypothetical protein